MVAGLSAEQVEAAEAERGSGESRRSRSVLCGRQIASESICSQLSEQDARAHQLSQVEV